MTIWCLSFSEIPFYLFTKFAFTSGVNTNYLLLASTFNLTFPKHVLWYSSLGFDLVMPKLFFTIVLEWRLIDKKKHCPPKAYNYSHLIETYVILDDHATEHDVGLFQYKLLYQNALNRLTISV